MSGHALLSASKAEQWLNCPPSARLQESVPDKVSKYAEEGTLAHALAENKLRRSLTKCNKKARQELDIALDNIKQNSNYCKEMEDHIQEYCEFVTGRFMYSKKRCPDTQILLEERLDFSQWVPEGYGTGDVVIVADGLLEVIDLKYGKGVAVSAVDNPQMRLYALGAWHEYGWMYGMDEIEMTIYQTRIDSISVDVMDVFELLAWGEGIKPIAKMAYEGNGEHKSGDHCRWCKVKGNCRPRAEENMRILEHEFKDPALLSDEEVGTILFITEKAKTWARDVEEYAFARLLSGHPIDQWKLVEGRSIRKILDKAAAIEALEAAEVPSENYLKEDIAGIGDLEKKVGKKKLAEILGNLIIKPPGKPTMVAATDPKPEYNSVEADFENTDFNMED